MFFMQTGIFDKVKNYFNPYGPAISSEEPAIQQPSQVTSSPESLAKSLSFIPGLGPIGSLIGSAISALGSLFTNSRNMKLLQEQWNREDTAYQRQVADMKKAGLNPNLINGSGAGAGAMFQMQNPMANFGGDVSQAFNLYLDEISQRVQLDNSMMLNMLRSAKLKAMDIANTYAPEQAILKIQKLKEELEALGFKNDIKELDFIIDSVAKLKRSNHSALF